MVRSIAWQVHQRLPRSVEVDELIGEGQLGLLRADRDYDPSKGAQFSTYAYWRVRGAMLDWVRQQDWYTPTTGLSDDAESDAAEPAATHTTSVQTSAELEDEDVADPAEASEENELRAIVRGLVGGLSGRSRQILEATLLNGQTLEQAGRAAGVHKGTAQRAQVRAFNELAAALRDRGLSELAGPALRQVVLKPPPERRAKPP